MIKQIVRLRSPLFGEDPAYLPGDMTVLSSRQTTQIMIMNS